MKATHARRNAALAAVDQFCIAQGFPRPPLRVERRPGRVIAMIGAAPDGREFAIGYTAGR